MKKFTSGFQTLSRGGCHLRPWGTAVTGIRPMTIKRFWPKSGDVLATADAGPSPPSLQLRRYANCEGLRVFPFLGHWLAVRLQV